ncbi:MAG TPA: hypothetical protein VK658_27250 [Chryseolinea sp.]|nr:hypothetical protein [Chryseolinea sp.]
MKGNRLAIALFLGLGFLLVFYFTKTQSNKGRKYKWDETYEAKSDQPYGTLFIQKLLARFRPGQTFTFHDDRPLRDVLDTAVLKVKTDYVFIGREIYLSEDDKYALLTFISAGNNAFISTVHMPFDLIDETEAALCESEVFLRENEQQIAKMNFINVALKTSEGYSYRYRFGPEDQKYYWNALMEDFQCDTLQALTPLGYIEQAGANFFRIAHGDGHLYIHTNPIVFTNYFLTDLDKTDYASGVFSYLNGKAILWDEFSRSEFAGGNNAPEMSPVSYILQQESLRYAWWLMLIGVLMYVLFTAKRRQGIIPVLLEKENSSREFVGMVAELHFQNANHHNIGRKKMKYFFHFVKTKYGLQAHSTTESYLLRLAGKSKIDMEHLQLIASAFHHLESRADFEPDQLTGLHQLLDEFYKNCK